MSDNMTQEKTILPFISAAKRSPKVVLLDGSERNWVNLYTSVLPA